MAALLDRYAAAVARAGGGGSGDARLLALRDAIDLLADRTAGGERTVALLERFAET